MALILFMVFTRHLHKLIYVDVRAHFWAYLNKKVYTQELLNIYFLNFRLLFIKIKLLPDFFFENKFI